MRTADIPGAAQIRCRSALAREGVGTDDRNASDVPPIRGQARSYRLCVRRRYLCVVTLLRAIRSPTRRYPSVIHTPRIFGRMEIRCRSALAREGVGTDDKNASDVPPIRGQARSYRLCIRRGYPCVVTLLRAIRSPTRRYPSVIHTPRIFGRMEIPCRSALAREGVGTDDKYASDVAPIRGQARSYRLCVRRRYLCVVTLLRAIRSPTRRYPSVIHTPRIFGRMEIRCRSALARDGAGTDDKHASGVPPIRGQARSYRLGIRRRYLCVVTLLRAIRSPTRRYPSVIHTPRIFGRMEIPCRSALAREGVGTADKNASGVPPIRGQARSYRLCVRRRYLCVVRPWEWV
ncbi:hypothetical protein EC919_101287 [Pseudomonas graminis]|nr:hypothetical protein EC919_101287 [Pseudomonas graminis]